jgi:hypothetical protein
MIDDISPAKLVNIAQVSIYDQGQRCSAEMNDSRRDAADIVRFGATALPLTLAQRAT